MKNYVQKIGSVFIALILLAPAPYASVWARGGGGGGGHGGGGHGGGGHFGGGPGGGGWGGHHGGGHFGGHHRGFGFVPFGLGLGFGYGLGYYGGYGWGWGGPYYGWGWGGPYYGWGGYYPPAYGYSAAIPSAPPVYVQRQDIEPSTPRSTNYWYYCRNPEGYYPYVKECAEGWLQVAPQPSAQQ